MEKNSVQRGGGGDVILVTGLMKKYLGPQKEGDRRGLKVRVRQRNSTLNHTVRKRLDGEKGTECVRRWEKDQRQDLLHEI